MPLLPQSIADLVQADGLPRVVIADDESQHVLFLDGAKVRSMLATDWPPPLPTDPTQEQSDSAIAARLAATNQEANDALNLRTQVIALAQSAVGVRIDNLTAIQVRALMAVLLHRAGAIDRTGSIKPLPAWSEQ